MQQQRERSNYYSHGRKEKRQGQGHYSQVNSQRKQFRQSDPYGLAELEQQRGGRSMHQSRYQSQRQNMNNV